MLLGLALTTLAASFGAPFWFDTIGRLASLRNTGTRPHAAAFERKITTRNEVSS